MVTYGYDILRVVIVYAWHMVIIESNITIDYACALCECVMQMYFHSMKVNE